MGSHLSRWFSHEQGRKVEEGLLHISDRLLIHSVNRQNLGSVFLPRYRDVISLNYPANRWKPQIQSDNRVKQ